MTATRAATKPALLRAALESDIPAITAIYAHHVKTGTASFETEAPDEAEMLKRMRDVAAKNLPYIVAETDGTVAGYAYAGPYRVRHAYRFTVENSIYMHPGRAGGGTGTMLLTAIIDECKKRGMKQMIAVIGDSGNKASIRLHEKCGFRHVGVLENVGFKFERWLDTVFMQRSLE